MPTLWRLDHAGLSAESVLPVADRWCHRVDDSLDVDRGDSVRENDPVRHSLCFFGHAPRMVQARRIHPDRRNGKREKDRRS